MFSSLATAVSGMNAAQVQLSTTGHNIANAGTRGYSRQRAVQSDFFYRTQSISGNGKYNQVGLGVSVNSVQQVRNKFLDAAYRIESTKMGFYDIKTGVGQYVENITGEMNSTSSIQGSINDLWNSLQEAVQYPESLDKRAGLVSSATLFMDRMKNAWNDLTSYQLDLNNQVKNEVNQINELSRQIKELNEKILTAEASGDNANDYRDSLNVALDDLNKIVPIRTLERNSGYIDVYIHDQALISDGLVTNVGLKYTDANSGLVEPVFTSRKDVIGFNDDDGLRLFDLTSAKTQGTLEGLLVTRGIRSETYASSPEEPRLTDTLADGTTLKYPLGKNDPQFQKDYFQYERDMFNITQCTIPQSMKRLDQIFNRIVTVINDALSPQDHDASKAPVGMDENNTQFFEMFSRVSSSTGYVVDRYGYDADGDGTISATEKNMYVKEDGFDPVTGEYVKYKPGEYPNRDTLYSIGTCVINPELLDLGGYQKLPLSANGDLGNPDAVVEALDKWYDAAITFDGTTIEYNISDGYTQFISLQATQVESDSTYFESQENLVTQLDNYRNAVSGVSTDEEMSNLLVFQRSYQAAARCINIIDSMIDTIINNMV